MSKTYLTVRQFSEKHTAFSQSSLRALIFHRQANGFAPAFLRIGRKILIDEETFFEVIEKLNKRGGVSK